MNCPKCQEADSRVVRSIDDGLAIKRQRSCRCGMRFTSTEVMDRVVLAVAISSQRPPESGDRTVAARQNEPGTPPLSTENHSSRTATQAVASRVPPLGDLSSAPSLFSVSESGPSLSNPRDLQFHERGSAVCAYCGVKQNQSPWGFESDHFVPRSAGGVPWGANMVPACHTCNQIKKHRMFASLEDARQHIHHTLWRTNRTKYKKARELCFSGQPPIGDPPSSVRITPDHPGFDVFWTAYPRKVARPTAKKAWDKATPPLDRVLAALAWQCLTEQWRKEGGQYIPHPSAYLNQRRWEDERPAPLGKPTPAPNPLAAYCDHHKVALNYRKPALYPRSTCPECKHLGALAQKRESSPQSLLEIGGRK